MGVGFFAFGLVMIVRPERVRANFDRFVEHFVLIVHALQDRNDAIRNSKPTVIEWLVYAFQHKMNGVLLPATPHEKSRRHANSLLPDDGRIP
jgi:hypothetical protein